MFENAMAYEQSGPASRASISSSSYRWREFLQRSFTVNAFMQVRAIGDWLVPNNIDSVGWFRDTGGRVQSLYFYDFYATRVLGSFERGRFETTMAAFRQGSAICRERGIRLVVFYVPIKFRVYGDFCTFPADSPCRGWQPWDLEERFARFCRETGIDFVSLTNPMRRAAAAGELLYAPEDSHWSAAGHQFVARQLNAVWGPAQFKN
jgi:hypothetical protein